MISEGRATGGRTDGIYCVGIEIGRIPIGLQTEDAGFAALLNHRYANFLCEFERTDRRLEVTITDQAGVFEAPDLKVRCVEDVWVMRRGDFTATWDARAGCGSVTQSANPYSIDSVLRIVHSLILAGQGGFLLHAASVIRNGRAFLLSGVSGAGKTTITRLAPSDAIRLTDEISYVKRVEGGYMAFGTPFAGELNVSGENAAAPIAGLYFLEKGSANRIFAVAPETAARQLLRNILFFTGEPIWAGQVFEAACDFVSAVPIGALRFKPAAEVWELVA